MLMTAVWVSGASLLDGTLRGGPHFPLFFAHLLEHQGEPLAVRHRAKAWRSVAYASRLTKSTARLRLLMLRISGLNIALVNYFPPLVQ